MKLKKNAPTQQGERLLLIDVSNSFTKITVARNGVMGRVRKIPTPSLKKSGAASLPKADRAIVSSVVPEVNNIIKKLLKCPIVWVGHDTAGVKLRYPKPASIGADRLANVAQAVHFGKLPAVVVDFGTAVTFDIIDAKGCYLGGIIAPGLATAASALHERTALLPLIRIQRITSPIGKSTKQGIQIGLLLGAVGIVREVVSRITREAFSGIRPSILATGGDAELVRRLSETDLSTPLIDHVDPLLTLKGLLVIAQKN